MLDLHRNLGRQEQLVAIDRRREFHAFFGNLAHCPQRKHLKPARIGQNRLVPAHETMQSIEFADGVGAGSQPKMEGITENDLRADVLEFDRRHGLYGAVGADRHEDRGIDHAMVQRQLAAPRIAIGFDEFVLKHEDFLSITSRHHS